MNRSRANERDNFSYNTLISKNYYQIFSTVNELLNPLLYLSKFKKKYLKDLNLQYYTNKNNRLNNYNIKIKIKNKYSRTLLFQINKIFNSVSLPTIYTDPKSSFKDFQLILTEGKISKYKIILVHLEYLNINMDVNNEVLLYISILNYYLN